MLLQQNIDQAEVKVMELLQNQSKEYINSHFVAELGRSFYLLRNYQRSFLYFTLQRSVFQNDTVEKQTDLIFREAAMHLGKNTRDVQSMEVCFAEVATMNHNDKLIKWLEINTFAFANKNSDVLLLYSHNIALGNNSPSWLEHWQWLSVIGVSERKQKRILNTSLTASPIWDQVHKKLALKILRKSVKYYCKNRNSTDAKLLLSIIKEKNRSFLTMLIIARLKTCIISH